jgi:tRNA A-37 threonylcarbamoyl transferase component Bud32
MNSVPNNINIADYYFGFLKNLKHDSKLDLIAKLSESLKTTSRRDDVSLQSLFGAYKSEETADEIIAELRASRTFNRKTETL